MKHCPKQRRIGTSLLAVGVLLLLGASALRPPPLREAQAIWSGDAPGRHEVAGARRARHGPGKRRASVPRRTVA